MPIMKHEIPILEYDTEQKAVIMPTYEKNGLQLPRKAVFAFLGEHIDRYAADHGARVAGVIESVTKKYPVYILEREGEQIALLQAPMGAPAAAHLLDCLIGGGAEVILSAGCCGALEPFPEGEFLLPVRALRDEGTSYHYAPPSRFIEVNPKIREAFRRELEARSLGCREVTTWSTDGFFRETRELVAYRKAEGCSVVDMECAALAACAQLRDADWGMVLYTADTLADPDHYDERNWGRDVETLALQICLDTAAKL